MLATDGYVYLFIIDFSNIGFGSYGGSEIYPAPAGCGSSVPARDNPRGGRLILAREPRIVADSVPGLTASAHSGLLGESESSLLLGPGVEELLEHLERGERLVHRHHVAGVVDSEEDEIVDLLVLAVRHSAGEPLRVVRRVELLLSSPLERFKV